jgi:type III secretion protein Q
MTPQIYSSVRPLVLPRLNRNEAQARNLLAQRAQRCAVTLGGQPWTLNLEPWTHGASMSGALAADWLLQWQWAGAPFDLRLPASVCQTWMAAAYPTLDLPDLPEAFVVSALESALSDLMADPQLLQRGPMQLIGLQRQAPTPRVLPHNFGFILSAGGGEGSPTVHGALSTDALGLMMMASLVMQLPEQSNDLDEAALPITLRVEIGTSVLTTDELLGLAPGDTVMIQAHWPGQDGSVWMGWDRVGFRAQWNQDQLVVTHLLESRGLLMPADNNNAPVGDPSVNLQAIPVRLSFDLGERVLTLGELKALQVGQSFDLARPLSQAVHIRVNGALVGTGELVEIDGQVGVTITALGASAVGAE